MGLYKRIRTEMEVGKPSAEKQTYLKNMAKRKQQELLSTEEKVVESDFDLLKEMEA
jgi:hypothetical protein